MWHRLSGGLGFLTEPPTEGPYISVLLKAYGDDPLTSAEAVLVVEALYQGTEANWPRFRYAVGEWELRLEEAKQMQEFLVSVGMYDSYRPYWAPSADALRAVLFGVRDICKADRAETNRERT